MAGSPERVTVSTQVGKKLCKLRRDLEEADELLFFHPSDPYDIRGLGGKKKPTSNEDN
jgi:hypothetical protein